MTTDADRIQDLLSRNGALRVALERCLSVLTEQYGAEARVKIAQLRDDLIKRFKNADIPAEHELQHANVVKPAIEVIQAIFDHALEIIPK
jgi:hypothetical protein